MKKKLSIGLLLVLLSVTIIGCGRKDTTTPNTQPITGTTEIETEIDTTTENNTLDSETARDLLPFEGTYWHMHIDFGVVYDAGRYYDGTNAYYYGAGDDVEEGVYQYKFTGTKEIEIFTVYYIDLYLDGECVKKDEEVLVSDNTLFLALYYDDIGGGYFDCVPVESFDGIFQ